MHGTSARAIKLKSKELNVKRISKHRDVKLTGLQKEIIIGTVLGDGCISGLSERSKTARFKVEHRLRDKDYLNWKYDKLSNVISSYQIKKMSSIRSYFMNEFYELYKRFYKPELKEKFGEDGFKCPDIDIFESLSPLSLAIWYMDDGTYNDGYPKIFINFPGLDIDKMCSSLKQKFDIKFYVSKPTSNSTMRGLSIRSLEDRKKFFQVISPYIIPRMGRKVPINMRPIDNSSYDKEVLNSFTETIYRSLDDGGKTKFECSFSEKLKEIGFPFPIYNGDIYEMVEFIKNSNLSDKTCSNSNIGIHFLDNFFKHRFHASRVGKPSPVNAWNDEKIIKTVIQKLDKKGSEFSLRNIRGVLMYLITAPSHFKPCAAASIINHFNPKTVIDPTIGWGGRTLGSLVCSSVKEFVGIDLQEDSVKSTALMHNTLGDLTRVKAKFMNGDCIKLMDDFNNEFDLILTSPPFWNLEQYPGVSISGALDVWVQEFIIPFAHKCRKVLKNNGHLALHADNIEGYAVHDLYNRYFLDSGFNNIGYFVYNRHKRTSRQQIINIYKLR